MGACLASIKVALAALPSHVESAIWVIVDRSTDGTHRIVETSLAGRPASGWERSTPSAPGGMAPASRTLRQYCSSSGRTRRHRPGFSIPTPTVRCRMIGLCAMCASLTTGRMPWQELSAWTICGHLHPTTVRRY